MPAKNPRINIVCEPPLYDEISRLAEAEGTSLSGTAHELIREALDLREDRALAALADERADSFDRKKALSLDEVFGS